MYNYSTLHPILSPHCQWRSLCTQSVRVRASTHDRRIYILSGCPTAWLPTGMHTTHTYTVALVPHSHIIHVRLDPLCLGVLPGARATGITATAHAAGVLRQHPVALLDP